MTVEGGGGETILIDGCGAGCDSVGAVVMTLGCEELGALLSLESDGAEADGLVVLVAPDVFVVLVDVVVDLGVEDDDVDLGALETACAAADGLAAAADEVEETCFGPAGVATVTVLLLTLPLPPLGALDAVFVAVEDEELLFEEDEVVLLLELEDELLLLPPETLPPFLKPLALTSPPVHIRSLSCKARQGSGSSRSQGACQSAPP